MDRQPVDPEILSRAVEDTLAFLLAREGVSPFEFADGAYHTHQLAKELSYLLVQQGNDLSGKKEIKLSASVSVDLFFAMGQVEAWLSTWDKPPEKHPNIVVQGDVDHDFQGWLKTSLARLNTEEVRKLVPRTEDYYLTVIDEAKALASGYRIYTDLANKLKTKRQPWWKFW